MLTLVMHLTKLKKVPQVDAIAEARDFWVNCFAAVMFREGAPQPVPSPSSELERVRRLLAFTSASGVRVL